jgi:hypothetical protein
MKRAALTLLGFVALALMAALGTVDGARANGVPQLVKLTYLSGVSNFGPTDAEGVLEFSFAEAYARVDVKNLKPVDGYTYEGWLTGGAGQPLLVGAITPGPDGVGVLDTKLANLTRYDYNLFVIAGRNPATAPGAYPADHSIAGRFTIIQDSTTGAQADTRPALLPDTGETAATTTRERIARTLIITGAATAVAVIGLRIFKRRQPSD